MEIAINKQYGGFALSHKAKMRLYELKGITVYPYFQDQDYETRVFTFLKVPKDYNTPKNEFGKSIWYFKENPKCESMTIALDGEFPETIEDEEVFGEGYYHENKDRIDKDVIQTIKELGNEVNTRVSTIEIIEIPDGYEFTIHDYDGIETVCAGKDLIVI